MQNSALSWCVVICISLAPGVAAAQESGTAPVGEAGGACYPNSTCNDGLVCDSTTQTCNAPAPAGSVNGACYPNGTCDQGLGCQNNACVAIADGSEGGACYGNGSCNRGLTCDASTMVCAASPSPSPSPSPPPSGATTAAGAATAGSNSPRVGSCYGCEGSIIGTAQLGLLFPGSAFVSAADGSVDTDAGFLIHVGVDYHVATKFTLGAFGLYAASAAEGDDFNVTTVGATVKGAFLFDKFVFRPGIAFAYQAISAVGQDVSGFDIGAIAEIVYPLQDKLGIAVQLSFISQPAGGNDFTDLTFGPILFATAGVGYLF